jgi:hypothetical protein
MTCSSHTCPLSGTFRLERPVHRRFLVRSRFRPSGRCHGGLSVRGFFQLIILFRLPICLSVRRTFFLSLHYPVTKAYLRLLRPYKTRNTVLLLLLFYLRLHHIASIYGRPVLFIEPCSVSTLCLQARRSASVAIQDPALAASTNKDPPHALI